MNKNKAWTEEGRQPEASLPAERRADTSPARVSISLGAELSEGYVIRTEEPVPRMQWMPFQRCSQELEAPQALSERLAQQISENLRRRNERPISISCDLYPKFPTTYTAELLSKTYRVPLYRQQKCHRILLDPDEGSAGSEESIGLCLDTMSYHRGGQHHCPQDGRDPLGRGNPVPSGRWLYTSRFDSSLSSDGKQYGASSAGTMADGCRHAV